MNRSLLVWLWLTGISHAQTRWILFETFPSGAEVYLEGSGGPRYLGRSGQVLPIAPPRLTDPQGKPIQYLPGRIQLRLRDHQTSTITISGQDWASERLPRVGEYPLIADNAWVALKDRVQGYPWITLSLMLSSLTFLYGLQKWNRQWRATTEKNLEFEQRQRPGEDPFLGKEIGGYHLIQRLGQGGMATVYRATYAGAHYALKLLVADSPDDESVRRFRREFRLASKLRHPRLVRVIEFGEQDKLFYLVMELVEGRQLALNEPLDWPQIWPWYKELLQAIGYAHRQGVVHRDLKPQNILVEASGDLKVVDFGLARTGEVQAITETGKGFGTPSYLAPEQITGAGSLVEPRSDQYALGVLLFQALIGSPPFQGFTVTEISQQHLNQPPPRVTDLRPELPERLAQIIDRMLRKNPEARFTDLEELIGQLEKVSPLVIKAPTSTVEENGEETCGVG